MKKALQIALIAGMTGVAPAQTNAPVRDMGAGFAAFQKMGLPDVTGGTYGKLDITYQGRSGDMDYGMLMGRRLDQLGLSGNAWKIKSLGEGSNRYLMGTVRVVDVMDQKTFEAWQKRQMEEMKKGAATQQVHMATWNMPPLTVGRWKDVDIKKDVEKILKMFDGNDEDKRNMFQYDMQAGAEVLLAATHLYRLGMTNEANRIADRIFAVQRNRRQLIPAAIGVIAQEKYSQSFAAFHQSHDWAAWHKSLTELLGTFSANWQQAKGVVRLAELVKARVDQSEPPALTGEGLSEEDQKLARRLAAEAPAQQGNHFGGDCWIFPQPHYRMNQGMDTNDVMLTIRNRGMGSVALLVAMLKDNTLTLRDRNQGGYYYGMDFGRGMSEERTAEMMFNSIQRPATRGEIARGMLQPLLIMDDQQRGQLHRMSSDDLAAECESWYKEHKGKTVDELARIYMEKGDGSQRQYAMNYLMSGKNQEANRAEIEKMLLTVVKETPEDPYIVQQYVQQRREKASNFVEQVAAAMGATNAPAQPGKVVISRMGRRAMRGNDPEAFIKQLRELVTVRSVRDLLNEFVTGTQPVAKVQMKLHEQISREAPEESLTMILDAAQKVEDPMKRGMLIGMVANLKYARLGGFDHADPEAMDPVTGTWKANKFDPAKHAALWNKLLEDKSGEGRTIRETAAWTIETLYAEDKPRQPGMPYYGRGDMGLAVLTKLGERGKDLIVARARARLGGKPVPELPSADKVDAAQRQKMVESIVAAKDGAEALAKLTLDEQLALGDVCKSNKAVNAKLRPLADAIVEVKIAPEFKTAAALEGKLKGRKFDTETVRMLLDASLQLTRDGQSFNASIGRRPNADGTVVAFSKPPVVDQENEMAAYYGMMGGMGMAGASTNRQVVAGVKAWLVGGKHSANAWWPAKAPAAVAVASADPSVGIEAKLLDEADAELRVIAGRQEKSEQDAFWDVLGEVCEKSGAFLPASVTFYGEAEKAAAEPAKK